MSENIYPIVTVHDACYYMVKNDVDSILYLNKLTTKEARWQDHPDIYHPEVGLGGQLDIFHPDWSNPITLPENCDEPTLINLANGEKSNDD